MRFRPLRERVTLNLESVMSPHPLAIITPAVAVTDELKNKAATWELWTSSGDEPEFTFTYEAEERIVCTKGKARLTPTAGSLDSPLAIDDDLSAANIASKQLKPFTIEAGDSAVLMEGFACKWEILEPMEYHWVYTASVVSFGWAHVWCESEKQIGTTRGRAEIVQQAA